MTEIIITVLAGLIIEIVIMVLHNVILTRTIETRMNIIEKKQDKYNNIIERVYKLEAKVK